MANNNSSKQDIELLRQRLSHVTNSWAEEDYKGFINYYVHILPKLMGVERCTIYIMEIGSNRIYSAFGTGLKEINIEPPMQGSLVGKVVSTGSSIIENDMKNHRGFHLHVAEQTGFICTNMLCSPILSKTGNKVSGAVQILNKKNGSFTQQDQQLLEETANNLSISIETVVLNQEIIRIADYLDKEVDRLEQDSVKGTRIIAESPVMQEVLDMIDVVSKTPVNIMITGENGTGKELIARMIHEKGNRNEKAFVPVNCACIPETLIESEFFGHEKGAFTGADSSRMGRFEEASGGTLFLDEIAEMPITVQPKFLRAIQEQEGSRLGSNATFHYDLRLISATNKNLNSEMQKGNFREDLFFRLFSVEIILPSLRKRKEDILPLALHFLEKTNRSFNKHIPGFSNDLLRLFENYNWPGNVRQLMKEVERLVALTPDYTLIQPEQCSKELRDIYEKNKNSPEFESTLSIPDNVTSLEKRLIKQALQSTSGNKTQAAELLKLTRQGLAKKIKRYQLDN